MNILHLEDSANDAALVEALVRAEWPDSLITHVDKRPQYEAAIQKGGFDLILSDYAMPGFDGLAALNLARDHCPDKPFIFMSGTIGEERAIEALKQGAADYVIKDRPNRLVPAIRQAIKRIEETARRQNAERQVREQAALLDKAQDAIYVRDLDQGITYWNSGAERLYGWTAAEVMGQRAVGLLYKEDTAALLKIRQTVLTKGEWQGELHQLDRHGREVIVMARRNLLRDDQGRPVSILNINTDVTEQRKLEIQMLRNQRMESIGTLTGGIAHDLNNVLSPILMGAELLDLLVVDESARKTIAAITNSAQHGAALVRQLLDFARGTAGERLVVRLCPLLADLEVLLRQTLPNSIEISVTGEPDCRPVRIDATQIKQVVLNLCINARDAMPDGGRITITSRNATVDAGLAERLPDAGPGEYVRISVSDTGTGMPPGIIEKIFDPFFTTKEAGKGTGLGLSTVRGIAKGHGGFLQVESEMGRGTTFHLYLPAFQEADAMDGAVPPVAETPGDRREVVLVIDGDPVIRETMQSLLGHHGYRAVTACDGSEGVERFRSCPDRIAAVVTDLLLPGISGPAVIAAVRILDPEVPVIVTGNLGITGKRASDFDRNSVAAVLEKPVDASLLMETLRKAVRAGSGS